MLACMAPTETTHPKYCWDRGHQNSPGNRGSRAGGGGGDAQRLPLWAGKGLREQRLAGYAQLLLVRSELTESYASRKIFCSRTWVSG